MAGALQDAFVDISYIRTKVRITKSEISMRTWRSPMSAASQGAFVMIPEISHSDISMHNQNSRFPAAVFHTYETAWLQALQGFIHISTRDCIQLTPHFTVDNFASETDWNFNVFHTFCFLSRASYPQIFVKLLQRIRKDCRSKRPLVLHVRCKRSFFLVFWSETSLIENKPRILADRKSFVCL